MCSKTVILLTEYLHSATGSEWKPSIWIDEMDKERTQGQAEGQTENGEQNPDL